MEMEIIYNPETAGITGKSLRALRNALCETIYSKSCVVKVQTQGILCGFLVIDKTKGKAYWSGDGFRTDGGGEGGRGYSAAEDLIERFGHFLCHLPDYIEENIALSSVHELFISELKGIASAVIHNSDIEFRIVAEKIPHY